MFNFKYKMGFPKTHLIYCKSDISNIIYINIIESQRMICFYFRCNSRCLINGINKKIAFYKYKIEKKQKNRKLLLNASQINYIINICSTFLSLTLFYYFIISIIEIIFIETSSILIIIGVIIINFIIIFI